MSETEIKKTRTFKACTSCRHKRTRCEFISFEQGCKSCIKAERDDCSLINNEILLSLQKKNLSAVPDLVSQLFKGGSDSHVTLSDDIKDPSTNPSQKATPEKVTNGVKKYKKPIVFKLKDTLGRTARTLSDVKYANGNNSTSFDRNKNLIQDTNLKVTKILEILANGNISNFQMPLPGLNTNVNSSNGINSFSNGSIRLNEQYNFNSNHTADSPTKTKETSDEMLLSSIDNDESLRNNTNTVRNNYSEIYRQLYAPFSNLIRHVSKLNTPLQIRNLHDPSPVDLFDTPYDDVISNELLTMAECVTLLREFKDNYGAWVSFPQNVSLELIIQDIRKSHCSLLLTLYMVLSLRYTLYYHDLKTRVYKTLLIKLREDYGKEFADLGHAFKLEYIQSLVMLSVYSNSLSSDYQIFDSWVISGIGLKMFWSNGIQKSLYESYFDNGNAAFKGRNQYFSVVGDESELKDESLSYNRLYNHLCLAHLTNSLLSGRQAILQQNDINRCKLTLQSQEASHFDGRMLAEIELYWLIERFQKNGLRDSNDINLDSQLTAFRNINSQTENHSKFNSHSTSGSLRKDGELDLMLNKVTKWWQNWNYLSNQPIEEFIDFSYHFCYANLILMYFQQNKYIPAPNSKHPLNYYSRKRLSAKLKDKIETEEKIYLSSALANSERLKDAKCLLKQYPMIDLQIPTQKKEELSTHCLKALKLFEPVDLNHFRFLSDQLIYSVFYTAVVYLKYCNIEAKGKSLVKDLSEKFRKIREGELKSFWIEEVDLKVPSCILQYYSSLESLLREIEILEKNEIA
ncbi:hypothetical protein QEN19_003708 [Hanseniaspora menglaensis]